MAHSIFKKIRSAFSWERFAVSVILLSGFALRLRQYLTGRSLWLDEAMLALNIVNRDFAGLFRPLDYDQGAPIGFLLVEKVLNSALGDHEFVFRLFPFLAGVTAMSLFYLLLQRTTSSYGLLTGLALFSFGPGLVYYSSEAKQYILDVAVTIILLLLAIPIFERRAEIRNYIYLGIFGLFGLWFSHPAAFVIAGIGIGMLLQTLIQRERAHIGLVLLIGGVWLANLGLLYFVSLQGLSQNRFLLEYWQENFMPALPWSDWGWFGTVFEGFIRDQLGVRISLWWVLILLIFGFAALVARNKVYSGVLLSIFIFAFLASALRLYPLGGRLSLFLVPLVIMLISQSIDSIEQRLHGQYYWSKLIGLLIGAYLVYAPVSESLSNFTNPKYFEHIRPAMATLSEHFTEGDALFVSHGAAPAFRFYAYRYGLGSVEYRTSEAADYLNPENILHDLRALEGNPRVWVLITHVYELEDFNEKDFLLSSLDSIGEHKREFRSPGTSAYLFLYDLSP